MKVTKELLHLVPGDLDPGVGDPDAGLRVNVVLGGGLVLDLILTLDVDTQGMSHATLQLCRLVLDNKRVLGLIKEDWQCIVNWITNWKIVRKKGRRQIYINLLVLF